MDKQFMAFANQVSRTLIAAGLRKKGGDEYEKMKNERYQRTFTDEYLFGRKPRAGSALIRKKYGES